MRRHRLPECDAYRTPSRPDRLPVTVITVRRGEYDAPEIVHSLRRLFCGWRARMTRASHGVGPDIGVVTEDGPRR